MLPTTPFKGRLGTNYVPTEDETTAVRELIKTVEPQIVSLDAEIEALKQRRAIYTSFIADHRALISPIRYMPPDILRKIFSYCLPYDNQEKAMQASEAPLLLVQICRHWRDLAITTPTLWSTIFLKIPEPPLIRSYTHMLPYDRVGIQEPDDFDIEVEDASEALCAKLLAEQWRRKVESLVRVTTTWLSRAKGCSLTIFFREIQPTHSSILNQVLIQEPTDLLISLICAHSSQWAQLDLQLGCRSSSSKETLLSLPPSQTPQLHRINVHWMPFSALAVYSRALSSYFASSQGGSGDDSDADGLPSRKTIAPKLPHHIFKAARLQNLSLSNFCGYFTYIPVAWSNLTGLSCTGSPLGYRYKRVPETYREDSIRTSFTTSAALALLRQCPNLVQCELHLLDVEIHYGDSDDGAGAVSARHVHLPRLERLVVLEHTRYPSLPFFQSLIDLSVLNSMSWASPISPYSNDPFTDGASPPCLSLFPLLPTLGHQIQCLEFGPVATTIARLVDNCLKFVVGVKELTIDMANLAPSAETLTSGWGTPNQFAEEAPPPFYRDELLTSLTPSNPEILSSKVTTTTTPICPNLAILKLAVDHPSDIRTRALKNLIAVRNSNNRPSHSSPHAAVVPLVQFTVRFMGVGNPREYRDGTPPLVFPKRWEEDHLNSGFSKRIIKIERPRSIAQDAQRKPFDGNWDLESNLYEPSQP
ncbi:hypothetical protein BKA70DRAFT_50694 [Coprinopsis sp. MPI-PUGE-AT-0042]|nr:hypothetical protein BKA70DRAFT_50694 [Coprinopsis sp. MPI-PUGE-AT-0042]